MEKSCFKMLWSSIVQDEVPDEGYHKTNEQDFNHIQSQGVSASELNEKLSHLLIEQKENRIADRRSRSWTTTGSIQT